MLNGDGLGTTPVSRADDRLYGPRMTDILNADETGIARAAEILLAGGLVAFGTETVYGLGGDATDARAVAAIFAAKGRPHFNPLICHYADADSAFRHVIPDRRAERLGREEWPGPLTLVLPRRPDCPVALLTSAGLGTLAVRVPAHPVALALIRAVGRPVAAPSANRSGHVSPTTTRHVLDGLSERIDAIIDSGPCPVGVESTVLDLTGARPVLLRPGGATVEAIEALIGPLARSDASSHTQGDNIQGRSMLASAYPTTGHSAVGLKSPGLLLSHYAPTLPVRLAARSVGGDEALLAFGPALSGAGAMFDLSPAGNLAEAAARLFEGLRDLDTRGQALGLRGIAVMAVPATGLGLAINDRLARAAAPRPDP